ncbi:MAG: DUF2203 domain-containing protein [Candidatus Omnitrophica bacterium]|nr:DUF2203 domain-containing protein [Candidatus Omnitrophota bacterium]MDE2008742.1 DUF2203 domain-containing protein [Candidatus Omnitrophota bacterium]MDE2215166.1 DUF2203 domain-containing protein [Candidatus Omnitrophota bacterium]MDE2232169.1 DUF2203 domain-containing protein [Candidatus Omnitrophota bacterium]
MADKFFTPKQADQTLGLVRTIVDDILGQARQARDLMSAPDISREGENRLMELNHNIQALMARLEDIGCYYKDWNFQVGLVDFPAIIHGQQALLCWRSDEPRIAWFHGLEDGYAGRRPITSGLIFS